MEKLYLIKEVSNNKYYTGFDLGSIEDAISSHLKDEIQEILNEDDLPTGMYLIEELYIINQESRREDYELRELEDHISFISQNIQTGTRIQNGEGTNWVGYFRYDSKYKVDIERWFNRYDIEFKKLRKGAYYKVTGWDKTIEEVTLGYIKKHIQEYTLDTRREWIYSKLK